MIEKEDFFSEIFIDFYHSF